MNAFLRSGVGRWAIFLGVLALVLWLVPVSRVVPYGGVLALWPVSARLPVPVAGVRPRDLRDTFGAPRSGGRQHRGIDIFSPRGTSVRAGTDGVVAYVGTLSLGGQVVWVLGPGARWHYYAHLDEYGPVYPGQWIRAGQPLGTVGNTGNARRTPPHLHYAVYRWSGRALNPYPLLHG